jgi:hypothetical protein
MRLLPEPTRFFEVVVSMCSACGQVSQADGGIGCICGNCKHCNELSADESGYCFLCAPCKNCGRAMQMHTGSQLKICLPLNRSSGGKGKLVRATTAFWERLEKLEVE